MSKKNNNRSPEIPQVGSTPEIPNYVAPMTNLEYRETMDQVQTRSSDCREHKTTHCGDFENQDCDG